VFVQYQINIFLIHLYISLKPAYEKHQWRRKTQQDSERAPALRHSLLSLAMHPA
jgi:hypothetical protein